MNKTLKVERLKATIKMLEGLEDSEFTYFDFVKKGLIEQDKICGTVCCVAGWYPKYFPESKLIWGPKSMSREDVTLRSSVDPNMLGHGPIDRRLQIYHGLDRNIVNLLFYGSYQRIAQNKRTLKKWEDVKGTPSCVDMSIRNKHVWLKIANGLESERKDVIEFFKYITFLIQEELIISKTNIRNR